MISLRQHIFSLVAVFVALAVGIAAGSTVVRGPLLDSTRARLESAEATIESERAENDVLAAELAQLDDWAVDGPAQLLDGHLAGSSVLLVVAGDVDNDVVAGMTRSFNASAAIFLGEVRVDPVVFDPDQSVRVSDSLAATPPADVKPAVAFGRLLADLLTEVSTELDTIRPQRTDLVIRDSFGDLEDAGLVDLLNLNGTAVVVERLDVVVLTDRNLANDPAPVLNGLVEISDPKAAAITTLVAEVGRIVQGNDKTTPSFVVSIRNDGRLRDEVTTVDNAETFLGWVATVLGLEAADRGTVSHYGFREGADRAIPPRTP